MKKIKFIIPILLFIMVLGQPCYAIDEQTISTNKTELIDVIINAINIVVVFLNFVFVIWIYFKDKNDKKEYDKSSYKMYWYKKFILENYLKEIEEFFNNCEKNIRKIEQDKRNDMTLDEIKEYKKEQFKIFTENQSIIKQKVTNILSILNEEISGNIRETFIILQEDFTEVLDKMIMCEKEKTSQALQECLEILQQRKIEILKELYTYGEKIIN